MHSGAIWNSVLEVGAAEKILKASKLNCAFGHFSKNVVDDFRGSYWMSKYVHHRKNCWHLVLFFITSNIYVLLCTQFVLCILFGLLLWGLLLWQTSIVLVYFQNEQSVSTDHTVWGFNHFKRHVHNFAIRLFCVIL